MRNKFKFCSTAHPGPLGAAYILPFFIKINFAYVTFENPPRSCTEKKLVNDFVEEMNEFILDIESEDELAVHILADVTNFCLEHSFCV